MTSRQFHLLIVLTIVSGLVGGAASSLLLRGLPAAAQGEDNRGDKVIARKFLLVDEAGKTRASLDLDTAPGFGPADCPGLALYDASGKWRAGLCLGPDGSPALALYDAAGKWQAEGWEEATPRALLSLSPEGTPGLTLNDGEGQVIWKAP